MGKATLKAGQPRGASSTPARADTSPRHASQGPTPQVGIRVLCVDDHALLVEGLRAQFTIDGKACIVGRLASADRLFEEIERLRPDIVLLDIEMPGPDVFEVADRLRHMRPNLRFVFLSAYIRDGYIAAAYKAGAWGYFAKGDELEAITAGIVEVARSTSATFVMSPKVKQRCAVATPVSSGRRGSAGRSPSGPATPLQTLTSRELEVLRLIGRGLSRTEIAAELSRSAKTIDGHRDRIMKKLAIQTRAELMRFALREGLAEA